MARLISDQKRRLYPRAWHLNKNGTRWTEPPTEGKPVRTWSEFSVAEQEALLIKVRMWLDPDVTSKRRHAWVHIDMGVAQL